MANDLNQCTFIGRLGRDPEARSFPSGDQVCNFSIAVGESWKDKATGEKKERTDWINIVVTGGLVGVVTQYVKKGSQVMVSGKLRTREYTDKDGIKKYSTEIRADSMQMLGARQDGGGDRDAAPAQRAPAAQRPASAPVPRQTAAADSGFESMDDDIPFITASMAYDMVTSKLRRMKKYDYQKS
jgi:single-strand DNA-binding protein